MTTFAEFERNLEEDLQNETSGNFKRLLVSQCNAGREEAEDVDDGKAEEDAQQIYDVGSVILLQFNKNLTQDCHPRNTSDGSRQGSNKLIESLLIRL